MRQVLFRGKRIDNGEWVEGNLIHRTRYYGDTVDDYFIMEVGEFDNDYYDVYEVCPETVGEFTGLTDKNGTKVFEGDIVEYASILGAQRDVVIWGYGIHREGAGFGLKHHIFHQIEDDDSKYFEVVGNIYDNADLLEGKNG